MADKQYTHEVYHGRTGEVVGKYTTFSGARAGRDRRDNDYGGYAYRVRAIPQSTPEDPGTKE
jgi:hypothetical protein